MTNPAWLIQIFEMTDVAARDLIADLLMGVDGLTVEATQNGPDCFLIVQSHDEEQALSVARMVVASDARAILLHTSLGPARPVELVPHISRIGPRALHVLPDEWSDSEEEDRPDAASV